MQVPSRSPSAWSEKGLVCRVVQTTISLTQTLQVALNGSTQSFRVRSSEGNAGYMF